MPTSTNTNTVPFQTNVDIKVRTEIEVKIIVKKAIWSYVEATQSKCWGLVDAAIEAKTKGMDEAAARAVFNWAFAEIANGDLKSPEYMTGKALGSKAVKIGYNALYSKMEKWKKAGKGFNAFYATISTPRKPMEARPGGNPNKQKEELTEGVKQGEANADTYLGSIMKGAPKTNNNQQDEEDKPSGWTAPTVSGKPTGDLWYKETKATLIDLPNKFMEAITKLARNDILTIEKMIDLIEAYIGDDLEEMGPRWHELIHTLAKNNEEALAAIKKVMKKLEASEKDDASFEMRRISTNNQKKLVGKKR
jgi:hypothetical protein